MKPDVILANHTRTVAAMQRADPDHPDCFHRHADPVGSGFVANLPRPGGNIIGFTLPGPTMAGK